ncbi:hypothetical protein JTE90_021903 [Oedothorax gibbosus]|uniref:Epoxide hydrolase n=1 Tax=Oedothorax gibbosus TaxID=931172 RepID=A0AAV6VVG9_9ARAC|nr:hypothetical protein JTE90_021903 [Oedothorax gibbosus]
MSCDCCCVTLIIGSLVTIFVLRFIYRALFSQKKPDTRGYKEGWFGKGPGPTEGNATEDTSIRPFKINVPDEVLTDLKNRLELTRFEDPLEDCKFFYGFHSKALRPLVEYWKTKYDWRQQERMLNQFEHFKTKIEGIDVHFMHVKPVLPEGSNIKIFPLMIIHGWPGSFVEFYKLVPLLTTPSPQRNFVFEVICPSIPGYGFSESPHQKGFNGRACARVFLTLMERIGHPKFFVQGGDWGSFIANLMARYYSPRILGLHLNMFFFSLSSWDLVKYLVINFFPFLVRPEEYNIAFPMKKKIAMLMQESGYFHMQTTKPDTLGCAMSDSPAGTAAYLLEKFAAGTNPEGLKKEDGGLTEKFSHDELLTNVMMYWLNNNFTAAARFYKENIRDILSKRHERTPITVPSAVALFPHEVLLYPKMLLSGQMKNLVSYNIMPRGGHFAALEEPELLADDIWNFVEIVKEKYL